jgi:2-polyprenyl-3-methyl-5-hydroxy-6-metoxy-1,4-benzoquinol methylase
MEIKSMNRTQKFWDRMANNYDRQVNQDDDAAIKTIEKTKHYLKRSHVVLDYACATGKFTFEFAGLVKDVQGLDISSKMIAVAQNNAAQRQIENIHFEQTTIFDERYTKEMFDVILAFNILHLVEDPQQVVERIFSLLKPGGFFISDTPCLGEGKPFMSFVLSLLGKVRLVPRISIFSIAELTTLIAQPNFQIMDAEDGGEAPVHYFICARRM